MGTATIAKSNEFKEIMNDFTNPLEIIRESIQNSLDAHCKTLIININNNNTAIGKSLDIIIEDDGDGISIDKFCNFFDLGNSTKTGNSESIGEKGHGTKIFYNSNKVTLESWVDNKKYVSILEYPYKRIFEGAELNYTDPAEEKNIENKKSGTRVTIEGYLKNTSNSPLDKFSHPAIKDYILWFTAFGSVIREFDNIDSINKTLKNKSFPVLYLRSYDSNYKSLQDEFSFSLNSEGYEEIEFGHVFPKKALVKPADLKMLAKQYNIRNWEDLFCKRFICKEITIDGLEKPVQIIIWAEGDKLKRLYNPLIKERKNSSTREFQYKVSDRYGFWACKNFIPIQKVDYWITGKGNYTKFHAFINYDDFSLTANRSSIENSPPEILNKIREKVDSFFQEVINKKDYTDWQEIEESAAQERNAETEEKEYTNRIKKSSKRKKLIIGNITYFEPEYEGEVALLFNGLLEKYPDFLPYEILDYNTYKGIDFLVKQKNDVPINNDRTVGYVELKYNLEKTRFNHSFKNLKMIVCYNNKGLKVDECFSDLNSKTFKVSKNRNGYFLDDFDDQVGHNIKIIILKDLLENLGLKFE